MRAVVRIAPLLIVFAAENTYALSTGFTYQGQLLQSGLPTDGTCDFQFGLFAVDSGGTASGTQTASPVNVTNGLFTVQLNNSGQLGANVFNGSDRWLEIAVRCPVGIGSYVTLSPRQQLTATPYALYAPTAGSANGLSCTGCVSSSSIAGGTIQQSNLAFTPGTVTAITAGTGLSGGTITTSGTISNSGVLSVGASAPLASSGGQNPSVSLTGTVPVANGGTGASTGAAARTSLGAAASGANADITSLSAITDGDANTAVGDGAFASNSSGLVSNNTAVGESALHFDIHGNDNTALGANALVHNDNNNNTAVGSSALQANTSGHDNTALGAVALDAITTSSNSNTAVGGSALGNLTSGSGNIAIGKDAGASATTGSNDIYIGNTGTNESNTTRIGTAQTRVFIAGSNGAGITGGAPVVVNAAGQIGTVTGGSTRFTDNGDGTVTDHTTALMWEKKTGTVGAAVDCSTTTCSSPQNVNNGYQWCQDGNHNLVCDHFGLYSDNPPDGGAFGDFLARTNGVLCSLNTCTGLGGHTDWRLPTIAELKTIVDLSATGCGSGSPCINPIFGPTVPNYYWSATTYAGGSPGTAWGVYFDHGFVLTNAKWFDLYVRAVRGGL
jgi:hypothetical protein